MQAQIVMLVTTLVGLGHTNCQGGGSPLNRYEASRTEVVAATAAENASFSDGRRKAYSLIASDQSVKQAASTTKVLPGAMPSDLPDTQLPEAGLTEACAPLSTKCGAETDRSQLKKRPGPHPVPAGKARASCMKKTLWTSTNKAVADEEEIAVCRPHASIYSGVKLADKGSGKKRGCLKNFLLERIKPEIFDESSIRSGKNDRRLHRIPGQQPVDQGLDSCTPVK